MATDDANWPELTLDEQIGQVVVAGFPGHTPSAEILDLIAQDHLGNIILFARNCADAAQVAVLTAQLQAAAMAAGQPLPLLITIDQELGMVRRISRGVTGFPGNMALGATGSPALVEAVAAAAGRELAAAGVNLNLAPVADVNSDPANPIVGVRSFGSDPLLVGPLAAAAVRGYATAGIGAMLKHFPGHGDTAVDSHLGLPVVTKTRAELDALELVPFRAGIAAGVPSVMIAHIAFPAITGHADLPALAEPAIVQDLLRRDLGFDGVIASDCLEMQAVVKTLGTAQGAVAALLAGIDLVLVSHTPELQRGAIAAIRAAVQSGELPAARLADAARRVMRLKQRLAQAPAPPPIDRAAHQRLADAAYGASVTLIRDDPHRLPLRLAPQDGLLILGPQAQALSQAEDNMDQIATLADALRQYHPQTGFAAFPLRPDPTMIAARVRQAQDVEMVILVTLNAHQYAEQAALAQALQATGKPLIMLVARDPYDLNVLPLGGTVLCTYESTSGAFNAAADVLFGATEPRGQLLVALH